MTEHFLPADMVRAVTDLGTHEGFMSGYGNDLETEAPPQRMNRPQKCNDGLYGGQLSGTAFTAPGHQIERTWRYRIRPSVKHANRVKRIGLPQWTSARCTGPDIISLGQDRWDLLLMPDRPLTSIKGMSTMVIAGDENTQTGVVSQVYRVTGSTKGACFLSVAGELLVAAQEGRLRFCTGLGVNDLEPREICILLVCGGEVLEGPAQGFVCATQGQTCTLPGGGPIGANCTANPSDRKTPVAAFEDRETPLTVVVKWCSQCHETSIGHSPFDVLAWHGDFAPCKDDLRILCPVGAVLFDHPDVSAFSVLTAQGGIEATANIDFVLFRDRWMVPENTFLPPWYRKNPKSELMGNIHDAKPKMFVPGGESLHNCLLPRGPDGNAFEHASDKPMVPERQSKTMFFMFETRFPQHLTLFAAHEGHFQKDCIGCWGRLEKKADGTPGVK